MKKLTAIALVSLATIALTTGCTLDTESAPAVDDLELQEEAAYEAHAAERLFVPRYAEDHREAPAPAEGVSLDELVDTNPDANDPPLSPACGDGEVDETEWCDDGNLADGDGCSAECQIEHGFYCGSSPSICESRCGDGLRSSLESCDDGNREDGDGCSAECRREPGYACGDGMVVAATEECDDGNDDDGDGCNADCVVERGFRCRSELPGKASLCTFECKDASGAPYDCPPLCLNAAGEEVDC